MRILYVTPDIPWPLGSGGGLRKWNILQGLRGVGSVDAVVLRNREPADVKAFEECDRVLELPDKLPGELEQALYQSALGRGLLVSSSLLPREFRVRRLGKVRRALRDWLNGAKYDLMWFETARMAMIFRGYSGTPTVLDGDDFAYVRNLGLLRSTPHYGAKLWNYLDVAKLWCWERGLAKRFTFVVRCSEEDRALHPARNVVVIPNGTTIPPMIRRAPKRHALFVGMLGYEPNAHGLQWFLENAWPIVRSRVPDAVLDVVGKDPPAVIRAADGHDGVVVHGFVEELTAFYERSSLAIVPLQAGGGTRIKIVEALARALPVVATSVGAYGIPAKESEGLEREDSAAGFAERCAALLANSSADAQSRALAGREFVRGRYDWKIIQEQVGSLALRAAAQGGVLNPARTAGS